MGPERAAHSRSPEVAPPTFTLVAPALFLGNARAAGATELLQRSGITLCVNVSRLQPGPSAPGVAELRVPVFDDPHEDLLVHLEPTCAAMEAAVRAGGACLVYCKNGRSRSAAVCTAYLMRYRGLSLERAFQTVKIARPVAEPNPGFWCQLEKYEQIIQAQAQARQARQAPQAHQARQAPQAHQARQAPQAHQAPQAPQARQAREPADPGSARHGPQPAAR
uniref:dual specificity phosphatase 28 isoform X2 n=1 Tax=Callospermophilus lateralis TaxID=76772 RepID=UPI004038A89E